MLDLPDAALLPFDLPSPYILIQSYGHADVFAADALFARIRTFVPGHFAPPLGKSLINPLRPAMCMHSAPTGDSFGVLCSFSDACVAAATLFEASAGVGGPSPAAIAANIAV
ncbi:MAG: hypothetical protein ACLPWS_09720 [Rhodomicrobium sp.]